MDISERTGQYLHGPDDTLHLSFPTGGVPRSFTIIAYSAVEVDEIDLSRDGIAILDNDHMTVVLDGHLRAAPDRQAAFMDQVKVMDWREFTEFCTTHRRFRNSSPDLHSQKPDAGILVNQLHRGVVDQKTSEGDLRSPNMIRADKDRDCPYNFPEASRRKMVSEILDHHATRDQQGMWRLSWPVTVPSQLFNEGLVHGDKAHDAAWTSHMVSMPEISHQAQLNVLDRFLTGNVGTWPKSDAGRYTFEMSGAGNEADLFLDRIDGVELSFENKASFGKFLDELGDTGIRDMWKLIRVIDHDLSQDALEQAMREEITAARAAFEAEIDFQPEMNPV